jgi:hypothetical protein
MYEQHNEYERNFAVYIYKCCIMKSALHYIFIADCLSELRLVRRIKLYVPTGQLPSYVTLYIF